MTNNADGTCNINGVATPTNKGYSNPLQGAIFNFKVSKWKKQEGSSDIVAAEFTDERQSSSIYSNVVISYKYIDSNNIKDYSWRFDENDTNKYIWLQVDFFGRSADTMYTNGFRARGYKEVTNK